MKTMFRARMKSELQPLARWPSKDDAINETRKRFEKDERLQFNKDKIEIVIEEVRPAAIDDFVNPELLLGGMRERMAELIGTDDCLDFDTVALPIEESEIQILDPDAISTGEMVRSDTAKETAEAFEALVREAVTIWATEFRVVPTGDIVLRTWTEPAEPIEKTSLAELLKGDKE